jgi:hypothetical protein
MIDSAYRHIGAACLTLGSAASNVVDGGMQASSPARPRLPES